MKLLFLYGPPAAGKFTVAKELSKITGYKVFHNHLTVDLVESIFDWGTKPFFDFVNKYRLELIEAAASENINGLIFTFVYAKVRDDKFIKKIVERVEKHDGKVYFVQLYCDKNELARRLKYPSRKKFSKLRKIKTLKEVMGKYELFSSIPYEENLVIDNTKLSPKKVAEKITNYYNLKKAFAAPYYAKAS